MVSRKRLKVVVNGFIVGKKIQQDVPLVVWTVQGTETVSLLNEAFIIIGRRAN